MASGLRHLQFSCTKCGNCCRNFRVPLTAADLRRLGAQTAEGCSALVQWLGPGEVDMLGEPETFVELPDGRRLMVLRWKSAGGCMHLVDDQCVEHARRPASCRLYPFVPTFGRRWHSTVTGLRVKRIRRLRLLDVHQCAAGRQSRTSETDVFAAAQGQRLELTAFAAQVGRFNGRQRALRRMGRPPADALAFFKHLGFRDASG